MPTYLSSAEAAARLGVSRKTLYAYVSRGLLHAEPGNSHRESRYLADEVERLAGQRTRGRKPKEVAKATLSWGLPVLESAVTLIEDGQLFYRGENALDLAVSSSVEQVAAHIWQCNPDTAFGSEAPALPEELPALFTRYRERRAEESLLPLFTVASDDAPTALWQRSPIIGSVPVALSTGHVTDSSAVCACVGRRSGRRGSDPDGAGAVRRS
jgi:citrate synthase